MRDTGSEVRALCFILVLCIALSGCFSGKSTPVDPCAKAPRVCWGPAGVSPADVPVCQELVKCNDWQMGIK